MSEIISKKELEELKKKYKGEERGIPFKAEALYVLEKEGEEGLKKLEDTMERLGYPIKYREIKFSLFYPQIFEVLTLICIKRLFNYNDKKFQEIGKFAIKVPAVIRSVLIMRKFFYASKEMLNQIASKVWKQYYLFGDLKIEEYDKKKRRAILRMENFLHHPLNCQMIKGALTTLFQILIGPKVTVKEIKCIHRGDPHHEFLIKW